METYEVQVGETQEWQGTVRVEADSEREAANRALDAAAEGAVDMHFVDGLDRGVVNVKRRYPCTCPARVTEPHDPTCERFIGNRDTTPTEGET